MAYPAEIMTAVTPRDDSISEAAPSRSIAQETATTWRHVGPNLRQIREAIARAAERADRDPVGVRLVAVSKGAPLTAVHAAIAAGQRIFGENRVQEARAKIDTLQDPRVEWHLIGHLQRNKAKAATAFDMIESVDSVRVAAALDHQLDSPRAVLLEVNVAGETSKTGFAPHELSAALEAIRGMPQLCVEGLMTIAPLTPEPEEIRPVFRKLRALRDAHGLTELSMGMTNDYAVAIEEGATLVRIGRAIFHER